MRAIWKFPLRGRGFGLVRIHEKIIKWLRVGEDPSGQLCVWAVVDPSAQDENKDNYTIMCVGTGQFMDDDFLSAAEYLDTVNDDPYMWHLFALKSNKNVKQEEKKEEPSPAIDWEKLGIQKFFMGEGAF